jgi:hypothetical protein
MKWAPFYLLLLAPFSLQAQTFQIVQTIDQCRALQPLQVIPDVASFADGHDGFCLYDTQTRRLHRVKLFEMAGMEAPPVARGTERWKLLNENRLWDLKGFTPVFFDRDKETVTVLIRTTHYRLKYEGSPRCPGSDEIPLFVKEYERWYCRSLHKFLGEEDYILEVNHAALYTFDLKDRRLLDKVPLPETNDRFIGITGRRTVWQEPVYFYETITPEGRTRGRFRITIAGAGKDLQQFEIEASVRDKNILGFNGYSLRAEVTPDGRNVIAWEYDELKTPTAGFLANPQAEGFVISLETGRTLRVPIPVTAYGRYVDRMYNRLVIGSNQTGMLHGYDLDTGAQMTPVFSGVSMFLITTNPAKDKLLVFSNSGVAVHDRKTLKKLKTIPLKMIFPGTTMLLANEDYFLSDDGKVLITPKMTTEDGYTFSDMKNGGFHVIEIKD